MCSHSHFPITHDLHQSYVREVDSQPRFTHCWYEKNHSARKPVLGQVLRSSQVKKAIQQCKNTPLVLQW